VGNSKFGSRWTGLIRHEGDDVMRRKRRRRKRRRREGVDISPPPSPYLYYPHQ